MSNDSETPSPSMTTVPAAQAGILALLRDAEGLKDVRIDFAGPLKPEQAAPDHVWLGEVKGRQEWASIARTTRPRRERFTVEIILWVARGGNDPEHVNSRCWELFGHISTAIQRDPSLAGAVRRAQIEDFSARPGLFREGRAADMVILVAAEADLRLQQGG